MKCLKNNPLNQFKRSFYDRIQILDEIRQEQVFTKSPHESSFDSEICTDEKVEKKSSYKRQITSGIQIEKYPDVVKSTKEQLYKKSNYSVTENNLTTGGTYPATTRQNSFLWENIDNKSEGKYISKDRHIRNKPSR